MYKIYSIWSLCNLLPLGANIQTTSINQRTPERSSRVSEDLLKHVNRLVSARHYIIKSADLFHAFLNTVINVQQTHEEEEEYRLQVSRLEGQVNRSLDTRRMREEMSIERYFPISYHL